MKSAGKARNNGLYRHIRTSKEIIRNLLNDYANYDTKTVRQNYALHDPKSPFLIGNLKADDKIHQADQKSWIDGQLVLKFD